MKMYLAEAIKRVRLLSDDIDILLCHESTYNSITYRDESEKIISDYNYDETRKKIAELSDEILKLKRAINKANNDTLIGVNDYTISDGLVKMALIKKEIDIHLEQMIRKEKLSSRVDMRNDGLVYTELLYDPDECKEYLKAQKVLLSEIQMGIDRANLTTTIEI